MQKKLEITNEGTPHWHLAVKYQFNEPKTYILATQQEYIKKVARTFGVDPDLKKGLKPQIDPKFTVDPEDIPNDEDVDPELHTLCKGLIGSLLFPAGWVRPECSYHVNRLERHAAKPWTQIYEAAIRVLKFMVANKRAGI